MGHAHVVDKMRTARACVAIGSLVALAACDHAKIGGENPGEYNAQIEAKIADDPELGERAHTVGLAVQLPKGATKTETDNRDVYTGTVPAKWSLTIARIDSYSGDSYPALANMLETVLGARGKMRAPADAAKLGPYAAERIVVDKTVGTVDLVEVIYEVPYHAENKQGAVYQLTYAGRREADEQLIPLFDESARSIIVKE